jgi:hypothetical protein
MVKLERLLPQADGTKVKLVGQTMYGSGLTLSVDVFALHCESADKPWRKLSDLPHPDWRSMSVDEYQKRGRSELLQRVGHGPILAMSNEVRRREELLMAAEHEDDVIVAERPRQ